MIPQYNLVTATTGTGSGVINLNPAGGSYAHGTVVTATVTPATGSTFSSWSGVCSGSGACVVTMDAHKTVTATFTLNQYTFSTAITGAGSGTVSLDPPDGVYAHGTVVTVTASAANGSAFGGWSGACSGVAPCVVTMDGDKTVTASFALGLFNLFTTMSGAGSGAVSLNPAGGVYANGTVVAVTATPVAGSSFSGWSGACSGSGACTVTMDAHKTVTATFTLNQYTLSTATTGTGSGAVSLNPPGGSYTHGTVVTVTAIANSGSTFAGWSGVFSGTGLCAVTMDANKAVTASFTLTPINQYTLLTATTGTGSGVITLNPPSGVYEQGTLVTVTATANSGSTFTGWSGVCSSAGLCAVTMDANKAVTASFTLTVTPRISVTVARLGAGSVAPGQVVTYQVTITNVGTVPVQLTSIQGAPQSWLQSESALQNAALDAPCSVPVNLAVAAVHGCTLNWTATGSNQQTVNFVVTVSGNASGQAAAASGSVQVLLATPDDLDENEEPQPWRIFLPIVEG